jgi:hypothetical protein
VQLSLDAQQDTQLPGQGTVLSAAQAQALFLELGASIIAENDSAILRMKQHQRLRERQRQDTRVDIKLLEDWNHRVRVKTAAAREGDLVTQEQIDNATKT